MIRPASGGVQRVTPCWAVSPRANAVKRGGCDTQGTGYSRGTRGSDVVSDAPGAQSSGHLLPEVLISPPVCLTRVSNWTRRCSDVKHDPTTALPGLTPIREDRRRIE